MDSYDPSDFVSMGQSLRVLNAVRHYEVGIPLTYSQYGSRFHVLFYDLSIRTRYQHTTPMHLIVRLTSRNLHLLALRVSSFLSLKPDAVLKHWASTKIARSKSMEGDEGDQELCNLIVDKFETLGDGEVSYADIARRAWEVGRSTLATQVSVEIISIVLAPIRRMKLLDHEPRASDQVPLLLMMKEDKLALQKAVDSGDSDLGVLHFLFLLSTG